MRVDNILQAERVRLSACAPDDLTTIAGWYQGTGVMRLLDANPAAPKTKAELNLYRLQRTVFSYNERAIRLYERCGFQREGAYRELLQRDGERYDMLLYGLLAHEWRQRMREPGAT